jgi:hypothetical protein
MLRTTALILAAVTVAVALAAPVAADRIQEGQLDTQLVELRGEVETVQRQIGRRGATTTIVLQVRDPDYRHGVEYSWFVAADSAQLKNQGISIPLLLKQKDITIVGYRTAEPGCTDERRGAACRRVAARQIRFQNGCTVFVGLPVQAFASPYAAWGRNQPDDGLDKVEYASCVPPPATGLRRDLSGLTGH